MASNIDIVAVDNSGSYCVRKLKTTGRGAVVQVLDAAGNTGDHRTWHQTGYVHDRTTNPPSTTSTGQIPRPTEAVCECWTREDLKAGKLTRFKRHENATEQFRIDLRSDSGTRRFEAWYVAPERQAELLESLRAQAAPGTLQLRQDEDLGRIRILASFEPRSFAAGAVRPPR